MTNVKFNSIPFERTFTSLVDDFFTEIPGLLKTEVNKPDIKGHAPVNITETESNYQIEVVAPGYEKTDFKISLENNLLSISAERKTEEKSETGKSIRKEFHLRSFKRTFTIDNKIDSENVDAKYVNGILIVTLQRKEEQKATSKDIEVQ
ncbi:MAG TPA: Hsp20/alpha crystallin family protein [Niabella sp.]|nr:Hsp20/alpha crystallin family protein [Niabella sp.]HOZ97705.1 Hsp20/alpha crystallin family protein [Niabella sp.]HQW14011.1 Hsp20/alpha crystallin family protein [Niabella sp.]HQX19446.1 Hsp20/alpha crystallin family protein [Niabella sp.]HQX40201.1 Hsp20/alpha crystallin family protein [Niabella sp.]